MTNLLEETESNLIEAGYTPKDIVFIGGPTGHQCTWEEFCVLADKEYNAGYGRQRVASDLRIQFSDGSFMLREDYDGLEWWEFHRVFKQPSERLPITNLFCYDLNKQEESTL